MKKRLALLLLLLVVPVALFASAEGGGKSAMARFIGQVVNFVVLFGGLGFLMRKPVAAMFVKREQGIRDELEQAARGVKDAEEKRKLSTERLAGVAREVDVMREEAGKLAERSRSAIRTQAEDEKARLRSLADQELNATIQAGVRDLRSYLGDKAAEAARARIRAKLTPELHGRLIDNSINRLAGSNEKSGTD